mmetsp:Transcript_9477/g.30255  ORF Transcript_9477/g.30255 Transcript_9477/m.30255 type:complete len:362 (-) Transcript_9477:178-1263(-)
MQVVESVGAAGADDAATEFLDQVLLDHVQVLPAKVENEVHAPIEAIRQDLRVRDGGGARRGASLPQRAQELAMRSRHRLGEGSQQVVELARGVLDAEEGVEGGQQGRHGPRGAGQVLRDVVVLSLEDEIAARHERAKRVEEYRVVTELSHRLVAFEHDRQRVARDAAKALFDGRQVRGEAVPVAPFDGLRAEPDSGDDAGGRGLDDQVRLEEPFLVDESCEPPEQSEVRGSEAGVRIDHLPIVQDAIGVVEHWLSAEFPRTLDEPRRDAARHRASLGAEAAHEVRVRGVRAFQVVLGEGATNRRRRSLEPRGVFLDQVGDSALGDAKGQLDAQLAQDRELRSRRARHGRAPRQEPVLADLP